MRAWRFGGPTVNRRIKTGIKKKEILKGLTLRTGEVRNRLEVLNNGGQLHGSHGVVAEVAELLVHAVVACDADPLRDALDATNPTR